MTDLEYFAHPNMSNSRMTEFLRQLEGGFGLPPITDRASDLGHLFHALLFEPHRYAEVFAECKSEVSQKDEWMVAAMAEQAKNSNIYQLITSNPATIYEQPVLFDLHGVPFKVKPDARLHGLLLDGKSTMAGTYDEFVATFEKYGYWRQAVNYMDGTGADSFVFLGVSKKKGHPRFMVDSRDHKKELAAARDQMKWLCEKYLEVQEKTRQDGVLRLQLIAILQGVKE